jgi:hypothetical protein
VPKTTYRRNRVRSSSDSNANDPVGRRGMEKNCDWTSRLAGGVGGTQYRSFTRDLPVAAPAHPQSVRAGPTGTG